MPTRKIGWRVRLKRDRSLLLMVTPAIVLLGVFAYVPMLGNVIAWQNYSPYTGFLHSPFVGWANFERVFSNPLFLDAVAEHAASSRRSSWCSSSRSRSCWRCCSTA